MALNLKELNQKVNNLAVEMVSYSPTDIRKAHVMKIQNDIFELMHIAYSVTSERIDEYGNPIRYFGLTNQDVPDDVFFFALGELLGVKEDSHWVFNHGRSSFVTAFSRLVQWKTVDFYKDIKKKVELKGALAGSLNETIEKDGKREPRFEEPVHPDSEKQYNQVVSAMCEFGCYIKEIEMLDMHIIEKSYHESKVTRKRGMYYRGCFTFDTTKAIKDNRDIGEEACEYNDQLFPLMLVSLLEFLMVGCFSKMCDMLHNPLREGRDLKQRRLLLSEYFNISLANMSEHSKQYDLLVKACLGRSRKK